MGLDDFLDELDRRGADLKAWPAASRDAARELLARKPRAAEALSAMAEAEAWLADTRVAAASVPPAWVGTVTRLPQARPAGLMGSARTRRALALGAAAACLMGGLVIGAAPHFTPEPSEVLAAALNGSSGVFDAG